MARAPGPVEPSRHRGRRFRTRQTVSPSVSSENLRYHVESISTHVPLRGDSQRCPCVVRQAAVGSWCGPLSETRPAVQALRMLERAGAFLRDAL